MTAVRASFPGFPLALKAFVDGLEVGVEAGGGEGGHVEGTAEVAPAAADSGLALPFSGLAGDRGDAGEAGDGGGLEGSDLWQVGEDGGGADLGDAGNAAEDGGLAGDLGVCGDEGGDGGVDRGEVAADAAQAIGVLAAQERQGEVAGAVPGGGAGPDEAGADEAGAGELELVEGSVACGLRGLRGGLDHRGHAGDEAGIDAVGLGPRVPMASAKRRTRAGLSLAQGMAALCRARSSAPC